MNKIQKFISVVLVGIFIVGCQNMGQKQQAGTGVGAVGGAVAGAGIGAATGGGPWRILTGAAVGAVGGAIAGNLIGKYMDDQERALQSAMAASAAQNQAYVTRENEKTLIATFKSEVMFDSGSAVMKTGGYQELDRVAMVLNNYPKTMVRIEGYTDDDGSEAMNLNLSQARASAVMNMLIQKNVNPSRMMAIGMGKCCPISSDKAQNRRVRIVIEENQ